LLCLFSHQRSPYFCFVHMWNWPFDARFTHCASFSSIQCPILSLQHLSMRVGDGLEVEPEVHWGRRRVKCNKNEWWRHSWNNSFVQWDDNQPSLAHEKLSLRGNKPPMWIMHEDVWSLFQLLDYECVRKMKEFCNLPWNIGKTPIRKATCKRNDNDNGSNLPKPPAITIFNSSKYP
jgi:hypothetical protein